MDLYQARIAEGDLSEKLRRWLPQIGHIQIAGVPGRHEPDVGEINCYALFALLDQLGYDGRVGCEYRRCATRFPGCAGWNGWRLRPELHSDTLIPPSTTSICPVM